MKTTIILLSSLALLFSACSKQEETESAGTSPATASDAKAYPLDVCLVSGEKLGSMGEPVVIVHDGQQIKFCCDQCIPKFEKEPAKYLSKLETP